MQIPPEIIDKIRQAADIVDIIGSYITLKKKGANYWGPCPFHSEKTASFSVSPAKQIFKCFGCGEGGNVFTFLQKYDGLSFPEAVRQLGKKYNIEIPENELTQEELEKIHRRESLQVVLRAATHFFRQHQTDKNAEKYLTSRGFTSGDKILEQYHIGYAPASNKLRDELQRQGYDLQLLQDNSLIKDGKNGPEDKFQDRIMFPIFNLTGNPIGFQSRRINDALTKIPKYCNSDNNELFCKGSIIFGLYQARGAISREDKVYWVEGQFDVLTFVKAEIPNTVCGSGTAMTEEQIRTLLRFTRNITLIYDGDNAGQEAAQKNITALIEQGAIVRCVKLPTGEDPDSFARKMNPADLKKYLKKQEKDFASFLAELNEPHFHDPELKEKCLEEICRLIAFLRKESLQASYIKNIVKIFDLDEAIIWSKIRETVKSLPAEAYIKDGFYGIDESLEMLQDNPGNCILTGNFELFSKHYGNDPVVYFSGQVPTDQIQNFQRFIDNVEFQDNYALNFDDKKESKSLLLLKALFRAGVAVTVLSPESGAVGFAQYYVKMYGSVMDSANETQRAVYVDRCAELISCAGETVRTVMANSWASSLGLKIAQYKDILKPYLEKRRSKSAINTQRIDVDDFLIAYDPEKIPEYVEENEEYKRIYRRYGFFPLLNKKSEPVCYMFRNEKGGHIQVSDFYMTPLLHIYDQDSEFNKRVIKITRLYSQQPLYIEVKSKSLAKLSSFEEILLNEEALNFENGNDTYFKKIRQAMSYNYTKCTELKVFGQQSEGFFAFANAIFHKVEKEFRIDYADDLGVMTHDDENYYSPAYSKIYSGLRKDSDKYEQHRYFIFKDIPVEKQCSFQEWASLMDEVYKINHNGKWAVIYAIMCTFRSDIHAIDRLFTSLFFVGPTMSGKTQIAISIRSLFVDPKAPSFNLNSGTDAAFFTLMEGFRDIPQVLEEYNNKSITDAKFQGLKAITYDGDGKQKRKGINDRDLDTSKVNSPVIILGQETPERDDNALMNRVVLCEVPKRTEEYTARETEVFQRLKDSEKTGLCNVLFEILKLRPIVQDHFKHLERTTNKELTDAVLSGGDASGDMVRIIKTVSLFLTMCRLLETYAPHLQLPFTYQEFFNLAKDKVKWQIELISHSDKLAGFFKAIEVMINTGTIKEGRDYDISQPGKLTLKASGGESAQVNLKADEKILFIRLANLFTYYAKSSYNTESATQSTIEQNLRSNPAYIGVVSSRKFRWKEVEEVPKSEVSGNMEMVRIMRDRIQTTSCIALNYDIFRKYFDIDLERSAPPEQPETTELKERLLCEDKVLF